MKLMDTHANLTQKGLHWDTYSQTVKNQGKDRIFEEAEKKRKPK